MCTCCCIRVRARARTVYAWVYAWVRVWLCSNMYEYVICVQLHTSVIQTHSVRSEPVAGDPDMIQICARCGSDTQAIRRPFHGMICRSVPVRAVKTRRRFGSETASFHVSVHSYVFTVVGMLYMLPLSFYVTFCYIWSVWWLVPVHEISMIVPFSYIVDRSLYQRHFMCW